MKKRYLRGVLAAAVPWLLTGWLLVDPGSLFIAGILFLIGLLSVALFYTCSEPG